MKTCHKLLIIILLLCLPAATLFAATPRINFDRTKQRAKEALSYCKKHHYNIRYCMLVDMSLHSGVKRFMVWDFRNNDTLLTGMISHGCGINPWTGTWSRDKPTFSNVANSHCTSLGKYRVDARAASAWGIRVKYFLTGLESTNSEAFKRDVVLHSWEQVPDKEVYPNGTPEDWGCPAISNNTMKIVDALIRSEKGHLLLWIYN